MKLLVYVDGSVRPSNPGHTGSGAVIVQESVYDESKTYEELYNNALLMVSKNFGKGTNNTAELNALRIGARMIRRLVEDNILPPLEELEVVFFSDSMYALNCTMGVWSPKSNQELVVKTQREVSLVRGACFHVKGHSGHIGNDVAHNLANVAAKEGWNDGKPWYGGVHETWAYNRRKK